MTAGSDTTAASLEWALLELVRHPVIMERLQAEIDATFGTLRLLDEDEAAQLPYLQVIIRNNLPAVTSQWKCFDDGACAHQIVPAKDPIRSVEGRCRLHSGVTYKSRINCMLRVPFAVD